MNNLAWTSGETLWLRWIELNDAGNDHGLALDNFSLSWAAGAPPKNLVWNVGTGTWDTVTANWTGDATVFSSGDNTSFESASGGVVTVQAGGVSANHVVVSAASGTYTFQNTSGDTIGIGGGATASLAKSGGGTLILAGQNTYGGGTSVTGGGTLEISNNNQLGAASGTLAVDGGSTLATTAPITMSRAVTLGASGAVLATNGNTFTQGGTTTVNGTLTVLGAGTAKLNGGVSFGATGALEIVSGSTVEINGGSGSITMASGGIFDGDLVLNTTARVVFNGDTSIYGGTGKIKLLGSGIGAGSGGTAIAAGSLPAFNALLTQTGNIVSTINSEIVLNPAGTGHVAWVPGDVTTATYTTASFLAFLGTNGGTLNVNKKITGEGDLFLAGNSQGGGGSGFVVLNAASEYLGNTSINLGSAGVVQLGIDNALPAGTHLMFNNLSFAGASFFDLGGFDLQVASLSSGTFGTASGITLTNITGSGPSVLTISGNVTPVSGFAGKIEDGTQPLSLVKGGTHKLTLSGANTYSGGTNVTDGTLQAVKPGSLPGHTTAGSVVIGSSASLVLNLGGAEEWGDADIDAVRSNVTFTGTPVIGLDTSNATAPATYTSALSDPVVLNKLGANTLAITDAATAAAITQLTTSGGVTEIGAALGTGTTVVNANADLTFTASQTLSALNIGDGTVVTLGAPASLVGGLAVVPEPGSVGLLALGALGLLGRRRR